MNLLKNNFTRPAALLFNFLLIQVLLITPAYAINVSINGSENLTLIENITFDYQSTPRVIGFDVADPFVCTQPFNDANVTTVLNVNDILQGNQVLSAFYDATANVFRVGTDGQIQCASQLGIYNDVLVQHGFESSLNDIQIVLKDFATGAILNSASNLALQDGQLYQYKYEIFNNSSTNISLDVLENYLMNASPTFKNDVLDGWQCNVISGSFSNCGMNVSGIGYVTLDNAVIGAGGQLDVVVTRRVRVDIAGPSIKLDLLAAAFLNNNTHDSNQFNNIAFSSFATTDITATKLNIINQPNTTVAGSAINNIVVEMVDGNGTVDYNNSSLVSITINPSSPPGGTLSGFVQTFAVHGVATFANLSIDKAANEYKLRVDSSGLVGAISQKFNITPGAATKLVVTTQPSDAVAQTTMQPIVVEARDAFDNVDSSYTAKVFANIKSGQGTLSGTSNPNAVAGVASFNNLSIDVAGVGYTLLISSGQLSSAISDTFDITAIADAANSEFGIDANSQVNGTEQVAGTDISLVARIKDAGNNPVGAGVTVTFTMVNSATANAQDTNCVTNSVGECSANVSSTLVGSTTVSAAIATGSISTIINGWSDSNTWIAGAADTNMSNFGVLNNTANINTSVTIEAEIRDQFGNVVADESVTFQLIDSNGATTPPSAVCSTMTDANGTCTASITSTTQGTTTVKAFYGFPSTEIINPSAYQGLGKVITWQ